MEKIYVPVAYMLGGFALGRISYVLPQGAEQLFTDSYSAGLVVLILVVLGGLAGFALLFVKRNEVNLAYFFLIFGSLIIAPQIIKLYTDSYVPIPTNDYLFLVDEKEKSGNFEAAIQYLEKYKNMTNNSDAKESAAKRITILKEKLTNKVLDNQPK